jgi:hypothetical protein
MSKKQFSSNKPFAGQCNIRAGAGTIKYKWCPPDNGARGGGITRAGVVKSKQSPCFGEYDNLVSYVWEVDINNGNHLAYVDCDYVD